jgi:hypothetical protein
LANLLRYSLQSSQLETVPFEDELRVVNDYLALEQVRHEERLRLRLDVAPETLHLPVPPMLLQTLVENAVKYGISQHAEGGEIAIIARNEAGFLRLQRARRVRILEGEILGVLCKNVKLRKRLVVRTIAIVSHIGNLQKCSMRANRSHDGEPAPLARAIPRIGSLEQDLALAGSSRPSGRSGVKLFSGTPFA